MKALKYSCFCCFRFHQQIKTFCAKRVLRSFLCFCFLSLCILPFLCAMLSGCHPHMVDSLGPLACPQYQIEQGTVVEINQSSGTIQLLLADSRQCRVSGIATMNATITAFIPKFFAADSSNLICTLPRPVLEITWDIGFGGTVFSLVCLAIGSVSTFFICCHAPNFCGCQTLKEQVRLHENTRTRALLQKLVCKDLTEVVMDYWVEKEEIEMEQQPDSDFWFSTLSEDSPTIM